MITNYENIKNINRFGIGDIIIRPNDNTMFIIFNKQNIYYDVVKLGKFSYGTFFIETHFNKTMKYPIHNKETILSIHDFKIFKQNIGKTHIEEVNNIIGFDLTKTDFWLNNLFNIKTQEYNI